MRTFNIGVIGAGFMGRAHSLAYSSIPFFYDAPFNARLMCISASTIQRSNDAATTLGFMHCATWEQLINRGDVEIVSICTPNALHGPQIMAAAAAGKHVYVDKPVLSGMEGAESVASFLRSNNVINGVHFHNRFYPSVMRAKELIGEGRLGRVISFRAVYLHSGSVDPNRPISWKSDANQSGGGVILDLGSHVFDLIYHLIGEYANINARTTVLYDKRPDKAGNMADISAEDAFTALVRMKCGAEGTVEASKIATGAEDELRLEIHGDRGAIKLSLDHPGQLWFYDNTLPEQPLGGTRGYTVIECLGKYPSVVFPPGKNTIGSMRAHIHAIYCFLDAVYHNRPASPDIAEGLYIQRVMDAAYRSAREGGNVVV